MSLPDFYSSFVTASRLIGTLMTMRHLIDKSMAETLEGKPALQHATKKAPAARNRKCLLIPDETVMAFGSPQNAEHQCQLPLICFELNPCNAVKTKKDCEPLRNIITTLLLLAC